MPEIPFFSIITVTLNNLAGLHKTFDSLKRQSLIDYEWIVVDGASKDGTVEFLSGLLQDHICWISEKDSGLYDAMNKGLEKAVGKYLFFMNASDEFAEATTLHKLKSHIVNDSYPDFIYGDAIEIIREKQAMVKFAHSHRKIWYGMFTHHQAMIYLKNTIGNLRYSLKYKIAADYAFTAEMLMKSKKVLYIPDAICIFDTGGITSKTSMHLLGMKEQWEIGRDILKRNFVQLSITWMAHLGKHVFLRLWPKAFIRLRHRRKST